MTNEWYRNPKPRLNSVRRSIHHDLDEIIDDFNDTKKERKYKSRDRPYVYKGIENNDKADSIIHHKHVEKNHYRKKYI